MYSLGEYIQLPCYTLDIHGTILTDTCTFPLQNALVAYYNTKQATPEMKAVWKENIFFVNKLKVSYAWYLIYCSSIYEHC